MFDSDKLLELIKTRRSIRKYKPDSVPDDVLQKILEAAQWAPSGENAQPWRFIVIRDREKCKALGELGGSGSGRRFKAEFISGKMEKRLSKFKKQSTKDRVFKKLISGSISAFLADAPLLIVTCGRLNAWDPPYDTSAACMNILLMAHALGLGSCWVMAPCADIRDENKIKKLLGVPQNMSIYNVLAIGYPDEEPKVRPRIPLEEFISYEVYGNTGKQEDQKEEESA